MVSKGLISVFTSTTVKRTWWIFNPNRLRSYLLILNWIIPAILVLIAVGFQIGPAQWVYNQWGLIYHLIAETTVFALFGPLLAAVIIYLFRRWLEERDTADLQARLLAQAKEETERSRRLNDDALQILFASGVLIDTLKASHPSLPDTTLKQVESTEETLQTAAEQLRSHLLNTDQN
jgi:signal transduction histidine kinase